MSEIVLTIDGVDPLVLFGENESKLNLLRKSYPDINFTSRGNILKIKGNKHEAQEAKSKFEMMVKMLREHNTLDIQSVEDMLNGNNPMDSKISREDASNPTIVFARDGRPIKAKTKNQKKLFEASENDDIVFAIGPAGTGKTYTAVAMAVRALKSRLVKRIILTRPAVEAGESLGFLPGDLKEKVDPFLRPLYDALDDMLPAEKLQHFMETRVIEVAPLAYMRGRTLDNAFIILDEAQNTVTMQLKMFLTRLGPSSKCIITGDLTQIDLPYHQKSGLKVALEILHGMEGISVVHLTEEDVVRHRLVKEIIKAYNKLDEQNRLRNEAKKRLASGNNSNNDDEYFSRTADYETNKNLDNNNDNNEQSSL
ncbi:MAG: PhoH family protein [Saprospiraceae bacterium]|nr:PhoH family protein [Saprospiraceae bacterium]